MFSLLVLLIALALIGPLLTAYDPEIASPRDSLLAPSAEHWFGTNAYGGDIFSRVVHAARLDLWIGFSTVAAAFVIAAPLGALVGYSRAWWANIIIRVSDFIQSFPIFILAMALVAAAGANVRNLIVVLTLINIPIFLRLVRSEVLGIREHLFIEAARSVGNSRLRIVIRHVLPNALGPAMAQASVQVGFVLLLTAGLSFIGAGVAAPTPEWGLMIAEGARNMTTGEWWISVFPGLALGVAVLGFALAGEGVRNLLDVRNR